jgi:hypothetical protein
MCRPSAAFSASMTFNIPASQQQHNLWWSRLIDRWVFVASPID